MFKHSTGIKIEEKYWDSRTRSVSKNHPYLDTIWTQLQSEVQKMNDNLTRIRLAGITPSPAELKKVYEPESHKAKKELLKKELTWLRCMKDYIDLKASKIAHGTTKNFRNTLEVLQDFQKETHLQLTQDTLSKQVFEKILSYLLVNRKYRDSTVRRHIVKLKEFLRWAYPDQNWDFIKYSEPPIEDPVYVTEAELKLLMEAELEDRLAKTRDLFIFCALTGMRFSDSQRFAVEWIRDGLIVFRMQKTGGKAVVPIRPMIYQIMGRWNAKAPRMCQQKFNDALKDLFLNLEINRPVVLSSYRAGRISQVTVPLHEAVTSHTARRTFISLCLLSGIAIQNVMKMPGHSDYQSMKPYIAITNQHLKEVVKKWDV